MPETGVPNVAELGTAIRGAGADQGLTQQQLADKTGASPRWLVALENGRNLGADFTRIIWTLRALRMVLVIHPDDQPATFEESLARQLGAGDRNVS